QHYNIHNLRLGVYVIGRSQSSSLSTVVLTAILCLACAPVNLAPVSDATAGREIAPGVSYRQFTDPRGPWVINLVRVDLRRADIEIRGARALDQLKGR